VRSDITSLNEAISTDDAEKIREALERLKNSSMEIGKAIYAQAQQDQSSQQQPPEGEQAKTEGQEGEKKQ
jgi:hypothetical protein